MKKVFTANRIAALSTWLVALGALIVSVVHTFPLRWQGIALAVAALLTHATIIFKYLDGTQKSEQVTALKDMHAETLYKNGYVDELESENASLRDKLKNLSAVGTPPYDQEKDTQAMSDFTSLPDSDQILNQIETEGLPKPPESATKPIPTNQPS